MTKIYVLEEVKGTHCFHSARDASCRQMRREPNWFLLGGHDDAPVMQGYAKWIEGGLRGVPTIYGV